MTLVQFTLLQILLLPFFKNVNNIKNSVSYFSYGFVSNLEQSGNKYFTRIEHF